MKTTTDIDKISLHLLKVLHTVLKERSVSRTALKMGMHQPGVSSALRQLRALTGDALLVRSGTGMVLTEQGARMIEPCERVLTAAQRLFDDHSDFEPSKANLTFRIGASDFLDPLFLPHIVSTLRSQAPMCKVIIHSLSAHAPYTQQLASGELDVVIGNWSSPSVELHRVPLFEDDIVSILAKHNPLAVKGWEVDTWLQAEHIAPTSTHLGGYGVIDEHLHTLGLKRHIVVRSQNFSHMPNMVAASLLVLTTGRHFCQRYIQGFTGHLSLVIKEPPIQFPKMSYYQLWHERSHASSAQVWLRSTVKTVADQLRSRSGQDHPLA
jgi:DNA-binding transcriptional LysR family regulator